MITYDILSRIELEEASEFLTQNLPFINSVDLVIQLGSGQNPEDLLEHEWARIPLGDMPYLPKEESLAKHKLEIIWGAVGELKILIYAGRFHLYEGYGRIACILPIWAAIQCGARNFVITNSAVAINEELPLGTLMTFKDHINKLGVSAIAGHQHLVKKPFKNMVKTYTPELSKSFAEAAQCEGVNVHNGVYLAYLGPQFETPAEQRSAKLLGVDAIGMSTILEATVAHTMDAKVLAISVIRNYAPSLNNSSISQRKEAKLMGTANSQLIIAIKKWIKNYASTHL